MKLPHIRAFCLRSDCTCLHVSCQFYFHALKGMKPTGTRIQLVMVVIVRFCAASNLESWKCVKSTIDNPNRDVGLIAASHSSNLNEVHVFVRHDSCVFAEFPSCCFESTGKIEGTALRNFVSKAPAQIPAKIASSQHLYCPTPPWCKFCVQCVVKSLVPQTGLPGWGSNSFQKGCMAGPREFAHVSGFALLSVSDLCPAC